MSETLHERAVVGLHEWLISKVTSFSEIRPTSPILDLGCGTGAWVMRLSDSGFSNIWAVDRNAADFQARPRARFIEADLSENLELGDVQFDLITAIEVIEHLPNPSQLVEQVTRYLSNTGWFIVTTPNITSLRARLRFLLTGRFDLFEEINPEHIHPVLLEPFRRLIVAKHGLKITDVISFPPGTGEKTRVIPNLLIQLLRLLFPDELPGDCLCLFIRRQSQLLATI